MKTPSDTDHANTGLGERVKPAPAPAPEPTPVGTAGVFNRGGMFETNIAPPAPAPAPALAPAPAQAPWPWPQYAPTAPTSSPVVVEDSGEEE